MIKGEVFTHLGDIYQLDENRKPVKIGIIKAYIYIFKQWWKNARLQKYKVL